MRKYYCEGQQSIDVAVYGVQVLQSEIEVKYLSGLKETSKLMLSALYNFLELLILQILELIQESNHILD
ncbi:hypothetical protein DJICPGNB_22020 [Escherichia coli]|nr:hypothetical protein DJICPGNB_22020 [Escherichia coli]